MAIGLRSLSRLWKLVDGFETDDRLGKQARLTETPGAQWSLCVACLGCRFQDAADSTYGFIVLLMQDFLTTPQPASKYLGKWCLVD